MLNELSKEERVIYQEMPKRGLVPRITFTIFDSDSEVITSAELFLEPTSKEIDASPITVSYKDVIKNFPAKTQPEAIWKEFKPSVVKIKVREMLKFILRTFGPPVALYILGFLIMWIEKGFINSSGPSSRGD